MKIIDYKIHNICSELFDDLPYYAFDFKRHLKPEVALNKKVTKDHQGRPVKSEYLYEDVLYAQIDFTFTSNNDNMMISRKEELRYVKVDGTFGPAVVIKNKTYDPTNPTDLEQIINERQDARQSIIVELKGTISGVLQGVLGFSMDQVVEQGRPFWSQMHTEIDDFIQFGSYGWRDTLSAINITTTLYTWLATPVDANGTTLRDYIVYRLTY